MLTPAPALLPRLLPRSKTLAPPPALVRLERVRLACCPAPALREIWLFPVATESAPRASLELAVFDPVKTSFPESVSEREPAPRRLAVLAKLLSSRRTAPDCTTTAPVPPKRPPPLNAKVPPLIVSAPV